MGGLIRTLLPSTNGMLVDVGMNLGQTLVWLKTYNPEIPYLGFEPNPTCVAYVKELIRVNRWKACTVFNVALWKEETQGWLYIRHPIDASATIVRGFKQFTLSVKPMPVKLTSADAVLSRGVMAPPRLVKIDVEGAELEVVQGMTQTLQQYRPFVVCEILPVYDADNPHLYPRLQRQEKLIDIMEQLGYSLFRIVSAKKLLPLKRIGVHRNFSWSNYLFVHQDHWPVVHSRFHVLPENLSS